MFQIRHRRGFRFLLFALILLLAALLFLRWEGSSCLGVPFLGEQPEESQYRFRDYGDLLRFRDQPVPLDRQSQTIYISQNIGPDTRYQDLCGRLTVGRSLRPMYFLWDDQFLNLAEAAAQGHRFRLVIPSLGGYMCYDVVFTTLPVLRLEDPQCTELTEKEILAEGSLCLWTPSDPDAGGYTVQTTPAAWHLRGQTAMRQEKKSYKLTTRREKGGTRNVSLLGLGKDDDWILNPMSLEDTKVKELFAIRLWNELASEAQWDEPMSQGAYCELVCNGEYQGLYLLQRRVDRKYLNLKEDQILLKANGGPFATAGNRESYEIRYSPFSEEKTYEIWLDIFHNRLGKAMDIPNYADISIFIQLGAMQDNAGFRNLYCLLTPREGDYSVRYILWDTDMSMGMCLDFLYDYEQSVHSVVLRQDHDMIRKAHPDLDETIARRWVQLRQTLLSGEHLDGLLQSITRELDASGAVRRDRDRWGSYSGDMVPVDQYLRDRLEYLDAYYTQLIR